MEAGMIKRMVILMLVACSTPALADARSDCRYWRNLPPERAITGCSEVIRGDAQAVWAYGNRALVYDDKKDYARALADFTQAIELNPKQADIYIARGMTYGHMGDYNRAIADYTRGIEINPRDAGFYVLRGMAYRSSGEHDRANADFRVALTEDPNMQAAKSSLERLGVSP
jgi:tetratricopeptide (TPR) repeat protein